MYDCNYQINFIKRAKQYDLPLALVTCNIKKNNEAGSDILNILQVIDHFLLVTRLILR